MGEIQFSRYLGGHASRGDAGHLLSSKGLSDRAPQRKKSWVRVSLRICISDPHRKQANGMSAASAAMKHKCCRSRRRTREFGVLVLLVLPVRGFSKTDIRSSSAWRERKHLRSMLRYTR